MLILWPLTVTLAPHPIDRDRLGTDRARALTGRVVLAGFVLAKPPYTLRGRTVWGAADRDDGTERTAVLAGRHLDPREGSRVRALSYCG